MRNNSLALSLVDYYFILFFLFSHNCRFTIVLVFPWRCDDNIVRRSYILLYRDGKQRFHALVFVNTGTLGVLCAGGANTSTAVLASDWLNGPSDTTNTRDSGPLAKTRTAMFKAFKAWFSLLVVVWPSSIENGLLVCGARGKYGWCVISWRPSLLVFRRFLRSFDFELWCS